MTTEEEEDMFKKRMIVELDVVTVRLMKKNTLVNFNSSEI
jgi:hypothetical protein